MSNETRKEAIVNLKDPRRAMQYSLLKSVFPERAEIIAEAYPEGCLLYWSDEKRWRAPVPGMGPPSLKTTYILAPLYEPRWRKETIVDEPVDLCEGRLKVGDILISELTNDPSFRGLWVHRTDGTSVRVHGVPGELIAEGKSLYARFTKPVV